MGLGSKLRSSVRSLTHNPVRWGENLFMSSNPVGLSLGQFDKWTGGDGSFRSSMRNPWVQAGAGVAASFAGAPWYAGMAGGGGLSLLGGGNTEDQMQGIQMGGLGQAGGNMAQSGYAGLQSRFATAPPAQTFPGDAAMPSAPVPSGTPTYDLRPVEGMSMGQPDFGPANEIGMSYGEGGSYVPPAETGMSLGAPAYSADAIPMQPLEGRQMPRPVPQGPPVTPPLGGMGRNQMLGLMGAKAGLGFYQNYQQQKALEDELEDRERIRNLQMQAMNDPMSVPGMRARRDLAREAYANRYRAQYGGTEGGAFAKGVNRATDRAVESGVNNYVNTLGGIGAGTQQAVGLNAAAGGTPGGALAGGASSAMSDYMDLYFLNQLMGGRQ